MEPDHLTSADVGRPESDALFPLAMLVATGNSWNKRNANGENCLLSDRFLQDGRVIVSLFSNTDRLVVVIRNKKKKMLYFAVQSSSSSPPPSLPVYVQVLAKSKRKKKQEEWQWTGTRTRRMPGSHTRCGSKGRYTNAIHHHPIA
jgi:hypothetical protein